VRETRALNLLARPEGRYADVVGLTAVGTSEAIATAHAELGEQIAMSLETEIRYAGYIERQGRDVERSRRQSSQRLPREFDYARVRGLSNEVREKLDRIRPDTIGQAARIPGVTPAAVSLLLVHLKKGDGPAAAAQ
jgi:tRNA uridine 5-carboxymethylaminomethyl modification enzyme